MPACQLTPNVYGDCVDQDQTPSYNLGPNCKTKCCEPCSDTEGCCQECFGIDWMVLNGCDSNQHQEGGSPCILNGERTQLGGKWGAWELKEDREDGTPYGEVEITNEEGCVNGTASQLGDFGCKKGDGERPCMPDFSRGGNQILWIDYLVACALGAEWAGFFVPKDCVGCKCKGKKCKTCRCRFIEEPSSSSSSEEDDEDDDDTGSESAAVGISIMGA